MNALCEYVLRLADDRLVLGHRLSEWCGHGPILEEDIALANIALDLLGQANFLLDLAGRLEGQGRTADELAYLRLAQDFRNHPLVELPRGDFGFTMLRQFLFAAYAHQVLQALQTTKHEELAGIAAKAYKENQYHLRHSADWVLRLGDGTEESHERAQRALDEVWRFTGTLFVADAVDAELVTAGIAPDLTALAPAWLELVSDVIGRATLVLPTAKRAEGRGYRRSEHTEHLSHMLAEMQSLPRAYPGATW